MCRFRRAKGGPHGRHTPGARTAPVPAPRPAVASAPAQAYVLTLVLLVATTVIGALPARAATHRGPSAAARHWTGTWAAAASGTVPALPGASIRNVVHVGVGGTAARIRISNRLGTAPLRLGAVTVALQVPGLPASRTRCRGRCAPPPSAVPARSSSHRAGTMSPTPSPCAYRRTATS
ncbi:hypothetical protein [Streptomyces ossamyceticus]|uniref:hypothetical protein n=1 Tax=Streptomyces ossamyceticus TaxID=249581 RepID=UPI0006E28E70